MTQDTTGTVGHAANKAVDTAGGLAGQAGAAMTSSADSFVESAAVSDMYEIESSRVALERASSPKVREAAQRMIDDHTESTAKLKTAVSKSPKVTEANMPAKLDARRESMVDHLREAPADKFDATYLDQQTLAHEEAVTLMHHFRDEGDCQVLRGFAAEVSPIIEQHLDHMKMLANA